MLSKRTFFLGLTLVVLAAAGFALYSIRRGFSAREQPTAAEVWIASFFRNTAIPSGAKALKNPLSSTEENLTEGMEHWADHCASCHANNGNGDTPIGRNLYPKAPDMRLPHTQQLTDGELYYIIQNGVRLTGMPAWGSEGDGDHNQDSWKLVAFIRRLPKLTPEEEHRMVKLNPKTRSEFEEERLEEEFLKGNPVTPPTAGHHHH